MHGTKVSLNIWKKHVENTKELLNDPRRVFYTDESGFPRCVKSGNVFAPV